MQELGSSASHLLGGDSEQWWWGQLCFHPQRGVMTSWRSSLVSFFQAPFRCLASPGASSLPLWELERESSDCLLSTPYCVCLSTQFLKLLWLGAVLPHLDIKSLRSRPPPLEEMNFPLQTTSDHSSSPARLISYSMNLHSQRTRWVVDITKENLNHLIFVFLEASSKFRVIGHWEKYILNYI